MITQVRFLAVWWRLRPRNVRRATWFRAGCRIHDILVMIPWAIRNPRFWWFCRRVTWHYRYGLPMPVKPAYRVEV